MKRVFDIFYQVWFKTVLFIIVGVFVWLSSSCALDIIMLRIDNHAAVENVFRQGRNFDYSTSCYAEEEIKETIKNILDYSLKYQDATNFLYPTTIMQKEIDETEECENQIEAVGYIAQNHVENNTVDNEFIDNGFIILTPCDSSEKSVMIDGKYYKQTVDKKAIRTFYEKRHKENLEMAKVSSDENYGKISKFLSSMKNVSFAVFEGENNRVISNAQEISADVKRDSLETYFDSDNSNLICIKNGKAITTDSGEWDAFNKYAISYGEKYTDNFDLYISISQDKIVNDKCLTFGEIHEEMCDKVFGKIIDLALFVSVGIIGFILIILLAGKHEYRGNVRYSLSDKLPNDIHLILHGIVGLSVIALFNNSIIMIVNKQSSATDLLIIADKVFIIQAKLCMFVLYCDFVAIVSTIKRQAKNNNLIKNTVIYKYIIQNRKNY